MPDSSKVFPTLDQYEYHRRLEETEGICLVFFVRQGCSSCNAWAALLSEYQSLHPAIKVYEVDVERDPALAHELELFHLPAILLYINGQYHCELQSEAKLSLFEASMQKAIHLPPTEAP